MKNYPDLITAQKLFDDVIKVRRKSPTPFSPQTEKLYMEHCFSVAEIAAKIAAQTKVLSPAKAYVLGLLHDYGRIKDEQSEKVFHGLVGYDYLNEYGYKEAAKTAFSHCFYDPRLNLSMYRMQPTDYVRCREILKNMPFDDYDFLIQLSDILNDCGQSCTIEYRFDSVSKRHPLNQEVINQSIKRINQLKNYFDKKCQKNVYDLLDIKREKISV